MTTLTERIKFAGAGVARDDEWPQATAAIGVGAVPAILRGARWIPTRLQLGSLRDARLRLSQALDVAITEEEGQIVAEAVELNEHGWGANVGEAVADLQHAVAELYYQLESDQERLGAGLRATLSTLRTKIRRA